MATNDDVDRVEVASEEHVDDRETDEALRITRADEVEHLRSDRAVVLSDDLANEAAKLTEALNGLGDRIDEANKNADKANKNADDAKWYAKILGVVCGFLLLISGGFGYLFINQGNQTGEIHQILVNSCMDTNSTRTATIGLWEFAVSQLEGPNPSPGAVATGQQFIARVNQVLAPRDCSSL